MVRKTKEESDRTYHSLLDSALKLFNERGTANTTLNDIAHAVNMTRGAVYWHFQNKDDIIIALWNRDARFVQDSLVDDLKHLDSADPATEFRESIYRSIKNVADNQNVAQVIRVMFNSLETIENESDLQTFLRHTGATFYDAIENAVEQLHAKELIKPELKVSQVAHGLWSYMHGIVQMSAPYGSRHINLSEDARGLLDIYLDAVLTSRDKG